MRNRSHRASSSAREARPAARQRSISCLNARAVGVQSVLVASCLGLGDELLLGGAGLGAAGLEVGEPGPAGLVEGVAGVAEALPQGRLGGLVELGAGALVLLPRSSRARIRSPLVFHWVEAAGWPAICSASATMASRCDGGLGPGGGAVLGLVGPLGLQAGLDPLDGGLQGRDVADHPGGLDVLLERGQAVGDLLGGDVGVGQPGLEQVGRRRELVVLAGEVLQGLLGRGARVGADLALLVTDGDEDVALVVDPAEPRRLRVGHRRRRGHRVRVQPGESGRRGDRRAGGGLVVGHGQAFFSVTATRRMLIGAAGNPSVALAPPGATPAAAILSTISNPEVTVPKMV